MKDMLPNANFTTPETSSLRASAVKKDALAGKKLLILGLARQGVALARFAAEQGAAVTVSDLRSAAQLADALASLTDLSITYVLGEHPDSLLDGVDVIAISGSVPADAPFIMKARAQGIAITNDSQEFLRRCPTPAIGITGSAGKSTTTSLVGAMCAATDTATHVGGNIGSPLIAALKNINEGDYVVQELSSFQLEIWQRSPRIAAILNITPNHLDRHKTMDAYTDAKANILRQQGENDVAVLSPDLMHLYPLVQGRLRTFGLDAVTDGAFVQGGMIVLRDAVGDRDVIALDDIRLRGQHNVLNVLAAVTIADAAGVPIAAMQTAIRAFTGIAHRLDLVAEIAGVQYINDSIATAPERAMAAIRAFDEPLILLTGGRDKELDWEPWADLVDQHVKVVILFGDLSEMVRDVLVGWHVPAAVYQVSAMADAVQLAHAIAQAGEVVLLSPGGTSYDKFDDFAQRGDLFAQLVQQKVTR